MFSFKQLSDSILLQSNTEGPPQYIHFYFETLTGIFMCLQDLLTSVDLPCPHSCWHLASKKKNGTIQEKDNWRKGQHHFQARLRSWWVLLYSDKRGSCSSHLPFAVLGSPLELDVPVLGVYLGTVSDSHGHRGEKVQAWRTVRHLWAQEDFTAVQCLDTKRHTHTHRDTCKQNECSVKDTVEAKDFSRMTLLSCNCDFLMDTMILSGP